MYSIHFPDTAQQMSETQVVKFAVKLLDQSLQITSSCKAKFKMSVSVNVAAVALEGSNRIAETAAIRTVAAAVNCRKRIGQNRSCRSTACRAWLAWLAWLACLSSTKHLASQAQRSSSTD